MLEEDDLFLDTRTAAVLEFHHTTPSVDSSASVTPSAQRSNIVEEPEEGDWFSVAAVDVVFADVFGRNVNL